MAYSVSHSATIIYPNILHALVPTAADAISFCQALLAAVVFMLIGRLIARKQVISEIWIFIGSAVSMLLLFMLPQLGLPLHTSRLVLYGLAAFSFLQLLKERALCFHVIRRSLNFRVFVAATPVLLLLVSISLWQSDTLNSWIPNYQFLAMHHAFPEMGDLNAAVVNSLLCFPLLGYVGSAFAVSPQILMHLNVIFSVAMLAFLLRIRFMLPVIRWRYVVLSVPFYFLLNYHYPIIFSSYADLLISILLAVIIYLSVCMEKTVMLPKQAMLYFSMIVLLSAEIILIKASGVSLVMLWFGALAFVHGLIWFRKRDQDLFKHMALPVIMLVIAFGIWMGLQGWLVAIEARNQVPMWNSEPKIAESLVKESPQAEAIGVGANHAPMPTSIDLWAVIQEVLRSVLTSPLMALVFGVVIMNSIIRLVRRDTGFDSRLLYAAAILILSYIAFRILIFATVMQGIVTSEQRYAYHVLFAGVVTLALALPNSEWVKRMQMKAAGNLSRINWAHVILFYALFLFVAAPFIRNDVRERKIFMHELSEKLSQEIDMQKPPHVRVYFNPEAPHANHYAVLLRGLIAVNRPTLSIEPVDMHDYIPPEEFREAEFGRIDGMVVAFCTEQGGEYYADVILQENGEQRLLQRTHLPRFNDSKVQICE